MCRVAVQRYSQCPAAHSISSVVLQHDKAIYCPDLEIVNLKIDGMCFSCLIESLPTESTVTAELKLKPGVGLDLLFDDDEIEPLGLARPSNKAYDGQYRGEQTNESVPSVRTERVDSAIDIDRVKKDRQCSKGETEKG